MVASTARLSTLARVVVKTRLLRHGVSGSWLPSEGWARGVLFSCAAARATGVREIYPGGESKFLVSLTGVVQRWYGSVRLLFLVVPRGVYPDMSARSMVKLK